jgi:hypothetical protein
MVPEVGVSRTSADLLACPHDASKAIAASKKTAIRPRLVILVNICWSLNPCDEINTLLLYIHGKGHTQLVSHPKYLKWFVIPEIAQGYISAQILHIGRKAEKINP